jgi:hypothetical protein
MSKKILVYPETRQTFNYDCGANGMMSMLVYAGIEEREERIMKLAGTTKKEGTNVKGVEFVFGYFGQPIKSGEGMTPLDLRKAIDADHPTLIAVQAYRNEGIIAPYQDLWTEGHWVVNIGQLPPHLAQGRGVVRALARPGHRKQEDSRLWLHALGQWYLQPRTARAHGLI